MDVTRPSKKSGRLGVATNFASLAASSIAGSILALWATSHLARALGVESFGAFNYARTLVDYALIPASFGITVTASRTIARSEDGDPQLAGAVVAMRVYAAALGALVLAVIAFFMRDDLVVSALTSMALVIPLGALFVDWLYSAHEDQRWPGVARTISRAAYAAIVVALVSSPDDLRLAGWALVVEAALMVLLMWSKAYAWVDLRAASWVAWGQMWEHLKGSVHVGTAGLAVRLKTNADLLILGVFGTAAAVGYYSAAYRLVLFVNSLAGLYATVLLPRMSRAAAQGDARRVVGVSTRVTTLLGAAISAGGGAVAATAVITLMGPAYGPAATVTTLLMIASGFIVVSLSLGYTAVALGFERQYGMITTTAAVTNIALNLVLVPRFGMYAAALTTLATEVTVAALLLWLLRGEGVTDAVKQWWVPRALGAVGAMFVSVRIALLVGLGLWWSVVIGVAVFAVAVLSLRVLGKDDWRVLEGAVSS